jgi:hypothetical protein
MVDAVALTYERKKKESDAACVLPILSNNSEARSYSLEALARWECLGCAARDLLTTIVLCDRLGGCVPHALVATDAVFSKKQASAIAESNLGQSLAE